MQKVVQEFKKFVMRGNVMDLAVAVVIGGAFGKIITSLVGDIIMPCVGILMGGVNFQKLTIRIGEASVMYGKFIQAVVDFVVIALAIFCVVKMMNVFSRKIKENKGEKHGKDIMLLEEIRDLLQKR